MDANYGYNYDYNNYDYNNYTPTSNQVHLPPINQGYPTSDNYGYNNDTSIPNSMSLNYFQYARKLLKYGDLNNITEMVNNYEESEKQFEEIIKKIDKISICFSVLSNIRFIPFLKK